MADLIRSPETRAKIAASVKRSIPTRKVRWDKLFWEAMDNGDVETATAIMVEQIRLRLYEDA